MIAKQLKIWKPGSDLKHLLSEKGDATHFGGLSELRFFVDYLGAIPINSAQEIAASDIVLISNCASEFHDQTRNIRAGKVIQLVSDLNLTIPDEILGTHLKLCQIPYPKKPDWQYSSIEKAILLFQQPHYETPKKYTLVYGGGGRKGNRDKQYIEFLNPDKDYVSALFTSSSIFPPSPKITDKVTFYELQHIYAETKYGIVISDPGYYEAGMLTQRYWEYCLNGMVAFIDDKYDKFNSLVEPGTFTRVTDSSELEDKITYLETHPEDKATILSMQRQAITHAIAFMKGENVAHLQALIFGN